MTRKALPLLILVAAVLVSTTFTGCTKPTKDQQIMSLKMQNENLKGRQEGLIQNVRDAEDDAAMARQDAQAARSELDRVRSEKPTATVSSGQNVVMNVSGSVAFASGSDVLTSAGKKELDGIVRSLQGQYAGQKISIEGHTDNTPLVKTLPKWHTNLWLSANRARSVADYLMSRGIPEGSISVVGHGAGESKGRLVEIVVLSR